MIDAVHPEALRANFEAFSRVPGVDAELADARVPMLMDAGTSDPWHDSMRAFAHRTGTAFFSLPDADHMTGWSKSADVLPHVLPFLADPVRV